MELIRCTDLSFTYEGRCAVAHADFSVNEKDYICIVGENGSGKTTLVKGLLGLKAPSAGRIEYVGISSNEIGYLPQTVTLRKDFPATVYEAVISGCLPGLGRRPFYGRKEKTKARENMEFLGIGDIACCRYSELSGGQRQRALLARALCATEKLLILDEPAAGLDPVITNELYSLVARLNRERGLTVVMVSHDLKCAIRFGSKILHLETEMCFFGDTKDYLETEAYSFISGGHAVD